MTVMTRLPAAEKLMAAVTRRQSLVCVGLDPEMARLPAIARQRAEPILWFNRAIIEATAGVAVAYKLNLAFFEAQGEAGWRCLRATMAAVPPDALVILDAKRGDIGNTARQYAAALYDDLQADAATVSPYMGMDAVEPFATYDDRLTFVLAATSNPGAGSVQDCLTADGVPLYRHVARLTAALDAGRGCLGLVAGATQPERMAALRRDVPASWLLVPGIGAQGGDLAACLQAGLTPSGHGVLITVSRSVLYAASDASFADTAHRAAEELRHAINAHRP
jgi:orotidine-5'-phosphate decarboxylase